MATELEESINAALNTLTGQEPAHADPDPVDPDPQDPEDPVDPDPADPADPDPEHEERPVSRAQARIQKLSEERAAEKAAREAAERERDFYRQQALARQQEQKPKEEEVLDPDEKWRREANAAIQRNQLLTMDMADKAEFLTKYQKDPDILAMASEVEAKLAEMRTRGGNTSRENMLTFLLGQKALERRAKAPAVKKAAAQRVAEARGQPLGARSNVAATGRDEPSLAERLKDQLL